MKINFCKSYSKIDGLYRFDTAPLNRTRKEATSLQVSNRFLHLKKASGIRIAALTLA